jgi:hypothetical protein
MKLYPLLAGAALALVASPALADRSIIKQPGNHPKYAVEIEPHALVGLWGVPGPGDGTGLGLGVRASIPLVDNGFVSSINNSVAITFGFDWAHYEIDNWCGRYWRDGDVIYCGYDDDFDIFWIPVAMQWNFFLSENWSVFGEPGLGLRVNDDHYDDDVDLDLIMYVGGRFHFNDSVSLTMRLGWPGALSVGASFFL